MSTETKKGKRSKRPIDDDASDTSSSTSSSSSSSSLTEIEKIAREPTQKNTVLDKSTSFAQLGLHERLCETCDKLGYKYPTKIQVETLRVALPVDSHEKASKDDGEDGGSGDRNTSSSSSSSSVIRQRDLIGIAETGSGKTAAFVLPVLHHLLKSPVRPSPGSALVMTPTRYCVCVC